MTIRLLTLTLFSILVSLGLNAQCDAGQNASVQLCADGAVEDLFSRIGGSPSTGGSWSLAGGGAFSGNFDPAIDAPGVYLYVVSANPDGSSCGAADTSEVTVGVTGIPLVDIQLDNTSGCGSASVNFSSATVAPAFPNRRWTFGNGESSLSDTPFHTYRDTGCFDVSLTLTSTNGCVATDTIFDAVCVDALPTAAFSLLVDPIRTNDPQAIFVNESIDADDYNWSIPGIGNYGSQNPTVVLPDFEATYYVCLDAMADNGCTDRFCRNVFVKEPTDIFVPSSFTADRNSLNDSFLPVLTFVPDFYEFSIFDRNGSLVFETTDITVGWNGRHADSDFIVKDEVYQWKIKTIKGADTNERYGKVVMIR